MSNQDDIGRYLDLSSRRVRELLGAGVLPAADSTGSLDRHACAIAYIRYLRRLNEQRSPTRPLDDARGRLTRAQADLAEMEVKVRKTELVRLPVVAAYWQEMRIAMRRRILAIPPRAAAAIVAPELFSNAQSIISELVSEALAEIAGDALPDEVRERFAEVKSAPKTKSPDRPKRRAPQRHKRANK